MAFTRAHHYREQFRTTSFYANTLRYPGRLEILDTLRLEGACTVEHLARFHPISLSAISQHLKILREAQLVDYQEKYPYTYYRINKKNMRKLKKYMLTFLNNY